MGATIRIRAGSIEAVAELNDSGTAGAIVAALPLKAVARTWGKEIWFPIPVAAELEAGAVDLVEVGDLGYWPTGRAFCIFFGPTPMSGEGEIRPASEVNLVGRVRGDAKAFVAVCDGDPVELDVEL